MEFIAFLLGIAMMYSWVHFGIITFSVVYSDRSAYEKVVTWFALTTAALYVLGNFMK